MMKFKYIPIFATLFFFVSWSYAFEQLKLVCNGEFEETEIESFIEKKELTNIKAERIYLITQKKVLTVNNINNESTSLRKENKIVNVMKFKSFNINEEIHDGSEYMYSNDVKTEYSKYIVKINDDSIYALRSNEYEEFKNANRHGTSIEVEINRISGTFTEKYYFFNSVSAGYLNSLWRTLKGNCKKISKNKF